MSASDMGHNVRQELRIVRVKASEAMPKTSVILTDLALNILEADDAYKKIYGFRPNFSANNLTEIISERCSVGWKSLSECVSDVNPFQVTLDEINRHDRLKMYQCSSDGKIVSFVHQRDEAAKRVIVLISETRFRSSTSDPVENRTLPFLTLLSSSDLDEDAPQAMEQLWRSEARTGEMARAIFLLNGSLGGISKSAKDRAPRIMLEHIGDVAPSLGEVSNTISRNGSFASVNSQLYADAQVFVRITRERIYEGGPQYFYCAIDGVGAAITPEAVRQFFPSLTKKETDVVVLLAQGLTAKEISVISGKAQGTVTIQARSAMNKMGVKSLVSLVSLVCQVCIAS